MAALQERVERFTKDKRTERLVTGWMDKAYARKSKGGKTIQVAIEDIERLNAVLEEADR